jgi:hypothetical protein
MDRAHAWAVAAAVLPALPTRGDAPDAPRDASYVPRLLQDLRASLDAATR